MTEPHDHTSDNLAPNLVTWGNYQFAVWYDLAGELHIGRILRGSQRWGVNHVEYTFAGTPRTVLALPVADDTHNYPTLAVDGLGKIHIWANHHDSPLRAVATTAAHSTDGWLATAGWTSATAAFPSVDARCTYPTPVVFPDGDLLFYIRDGPVNSGSGRCDSHVWTRAAAATTWTGKTKWFQGLSVPDGGGPGITGGDHTVDDYTNWNAYPNYPFVESARSAHPGRLHMYWCWRRHSVSADQGELPCYGYSDDKGTTWKAIDGTTATLPFTPLNNLAFRFPGSAAIETAARTGNVVTATVDTPNHGIVAGDSVLVHAVDAGYTGTFTVTDVGTPNPDNIRWPQTAANDPASGIGEISKYDVTNGGGVTVDELGRPHVILATGPSYWFRRNTDNTAWTQTTVASSIHGYVHQVRAGVFWSRGHLWMLKTAGSSALRQWYPRLWRITGTGAVTVAMGGPVDAFGDWEPFADPEAYRRFGTIEVLTPDGNTPQVTVFGNGPRTRIAA